ncbi:hypothetical protein FQV08_0003564, partial [Pygoscelis antarcticus]
LDDLLLKDPGWDPNRSAGLEKVKIYQMLILYGIQNGVEKPKNLIKLYKVKQGGKEAPSTFYEKLCEVAHKWTDLNPEDKSNRTLFNMLFIEQSAPDIKRKLQKVEGADGMMISQLMSIACKVYSNREEVEKKEKRNQAKLQASLLAPANGLGRGRGSNVKQEEFRGQGKGGAD